MVARMARDPIIMALANPTPEIMPYEAKAAREDAIICTGRSDYPNQINNVLCFPFIFRGALDVRATQINEEMKIAAAHALAELARKTSSAEAALAYQGELMVFGRDYLIPKPFDPRLISTVAPAVAKAAMETGVAQVSIELGEYRAKLEGSVFKTAMLMRPVFEAARSASRRVIFAEGEDMRVLRAAQAVVEEGVDNPILIGRPDVIESRSGARGAADQGGARLRSHRSKRRSALSRLLGNAARAARAPGRNSGHRPHDHAHQHDGDRGGGGPPRRCRQHDLRHGRPVSLAPELGRADPRRYR